MLSRGSCRFVLIKRKCKPCGVTLYPGFSKGNEEVTCTDEAELEMLPYDDAEIDMDDHERNTAERGAPAAATRAVQLTTVLEYFAAEGEALNDPSTCPFTFLRVSDNLWMHINFVENEIHLPVRPILHVCELSPSL